MFEMQLLSENITKSVHFNTSIFQLFPIITQSFGVLSEMYCSCRFLMLHSTESLDLATVLGLRANSLSGGCKIILLNSSSFKACVHLLHAARVNQASQLWMCSEFSIWHVSALCISETSFFWLLNCTCRFRLWNYFNKCKTENFALLVFIMFSPYFGFKPQSVSFNKRDFTHIC